MRNFALCTLMLAGCATIQPEPVPHAGLMGGEMVYMADAARFTDCRSNRSYPIAMEAAYIDLERAYLDAVSTPGGKLYVTFEGMVAPRPKMEGTGTEASVVVSEFIHAWPQQSCEQARADAALHNTYWRIVQLAQQGVSVAEGRREPQLVLSQADGQTSYRATAGCNQLMGNYTVGGNRITFARGASTKMACHGELGVMERRLTEVLERAARWRILGNTLELSDDAGTRLGLFEAVYM